ncbi:MAG: beta-propeller fold lactonase family protein [Pseudomonadota bacterium]
MVRFSIWVMGAIMVGVAGCAALGDYSSDDPGFEEAPGVFEGRFLAVSDADMAGTAYADGKLEPLAGAIDEVTLFSNGEPVATAAASNSVVSWPQIVDVSADGRHAYVVETRGSLGQSVEEVDSAYTAFPDGTSLRAYEIVDGQLNEVALLDDVGPNPQFVEVSPNGRFLLIGTEADGRELGIIPLDEDGRPKTPSFINLDPPYEEIDAEKRVRVAHLSPDGRTLAVNVGNVRIQFYDLIINDSGIPVRAEHKGNPIEVGVRLAVGRWTPDGRFFLITDVNGYDSSLTMLMQRGGQVHVIAPPTSEKSARLIDSSRVGRFAEGLEISDDGTRVASIAMERTYLPELVFLETWPRRRTYLLTLLSLNPETGELTELDRVHAAGVLPEDVIFDETGTNLAVATFHRRKGPDRQRGFIDFFEITDDDQLRIQGRTQAVMRGPHDLVRLPN